MFHKICSIFNVLDIGENLISSLVTNCFSTHKNCCSAFKYAAFKKGPMEESICLLFLFEFRT